MIARLATRDRGKISIMVRGGRSAKSKFGTSFQLGAHLRVDTRKGRGSLVNVLAVSIITMPIRARDNLVGIAYLAYGCEMISSLLVEDHENEKLFLLLLSWLRVLEFDQNATPSCRVAFEAKALTFSGITPRLVSCVRCGGPLESSVCFTEAHGGAAHPRCATGVVISRRCIQQIETLRRTPLTDTFTMPLESEGRGLMYGFFRYQTSRSLNGYTWMREVEEMEL